MEKFLKFWACVVMFFVALQYLIGFAIFGIIVYVIYNLCK
jgi:hypothetical protein